MRTMQTALARVLSAFVTTLALSLLGPTALGAQPTEPEGTTREPAAERSNRRDRGDSPNNPGRRPNQRPDRGALDLSEVDLQARTIDGFANNLDHPEWGRAGALLIRRSPAAYADGVSIPAGEGRPGPRELSNALMAQEGDLPNRRGASDMLWQWGQFLDHDLDLTPIAEPIENFDIAVPAGDPWFDPAETGTVEIPLERSSYEDVEGVREQVNEITAFIDASNVYGSDDERAVALRTLDGSGRLRVSEGALLPFNDGEQPNAPTADAEFFLAGDFRANEQVGLTAMHTLFVREHNHWADAIADANPGLDGEEIYQLARSIVGAEMQAITYREFLPILLGRDALPPYEGYRREVDAGISNEFASAAFRVGHTMLSSDLERLEEDGSPAEAGPLSLAEAFFAPQVTVEHGIDSLLRGLVTGRAQEIDLLLIDDVRNLLFGPPGSGGLDLASLNIQRGREHGLADYESVRRAYGLEPARSFREVVTDPEIARQLRDLYGSPGRADLWVVGLAEPHVRGAMVGETFHAILVDQFRRLRDGDRFWYQRALPEELIRLVEEQTLARILRRNTGLRRSVRDNPFLSAERSEDAN